MKKWTRALTTAMILLSIVAPAFAEVLLSVDCPASVYKYELFTCRVTLYNDSTTDTSIDYLVKFEKGKAALQDFEALGMEGDIEIPALTKKIVEFNCWAKESGKDAFIFNYGRGKIDALIAKGIMISSPPIYINMNEASVTAGRRNTLKTEVVGNGYFVRIEFKYPPGILGPQKIDLGDVEDSKAISLDLSPDPYLVGAQYVDAYIYFTDDKGEHVLMQRIKLSVTPSFYLLAVAIALLVVLLVAVAITRRRKKKEESGS
ncbi:MAG: hypothetical protein PWQ11_489 [Candidatus Diapherotrites archaeon]|nr:hypothetical protein [Candidatus Diapherotrites archaeon]